MSSPGTQLTFSFDGRVQIPAQVAVFDIASTGLSTTMYLDIHYSANWADKTITLYEPLALGHRLRLDVYEIGGGNQIAKSNTLNEPIRINNLTGLNEIYLGCNYSEEIYLGSGAVILGSGQKTTTAIRTISGENSIECLDVSIFSVNRAIMFHGDVFGGIISHTGTNTRVTATEAITNYLTCIDTTGMEIGQKIVFSGMTFGNIIAGDSYYVLNIIDGYTFTVSVLPPGPGTIPLALVSGVGIMEASIGMIYFVKSISTSTKHITISDSLKNGLASTATVLNSELGNMSVLFSTILGDTWTPPCVMHNGVRLTEGYINTISETRSSSNSLIINSTLGINPTDRITFGRTAFGGIVPLSSYYVTAILGENELTLETLNHEPTVLSDSYGGVTVLINDYAIDIVENDSTAKLVFADSYEYGTDYIAFSIFGETLPYQLGYSLPETEVFVANGIDSIFNLSNYVGGDNMMSAVVEVDGIRQSDMNYVIDPLADLITFASPPPTNSVVSVTSFNFTEQQYLHTQHDITGNQVSNIVAIDNEVGLPIAQTNATYIDGYIITGHRTSGFVVGTTISFYGVGAGIGGITFGNIYYVQYLDPDGSSFKISETPGGVPLLLSSSLSVNIICKVYARPAVRITTGVPHLLTTNNLVRIDGIVGSYQLNNNTYYARVIDDFQFDIYESIWHSDFTMVNFPITAVSWYESSGYVWTEPSFILTCATLTGTTNVENVLECNSTKMLIQDTPIMFTGIPFGNVTENTWYYILKIIDENHFTMSESLMGPPITLGVGTGFMTITQWEQLDVNRLWVTINGYRVPSSSLRLNLHNRLSIMSIIMPDDRVTITNMIPDSTPNELVYLNMIDKHGHGSIYRANASTRTWLTTPVFPETTEIYVQDITKITHKIDQTVLSPTPINGVTSIGLDADKRLICQITVFNNTTSSFIDRNRLMIVMENSSPTLKILGSSGINVGDSLLITIIEGNIVCINGEQIRFTSVNMEANVLRGLHRGTNGTGSGATHYTLTEVFGILSQNKMSDIMYGSSWQDADYPVINGDVFGVPMQMGETPGALFLNQVIKLE